MKKLLILFYLLITTPAFAGSWGTSALNPPGVFSVAQYGATGVATDDCPAIQNALNAAATYTAGGVVIADAVTYNCATTLNYDPAVTSIEWNGAVLKCTMTSGYCINAAQTHVPPASLHSYHSTYKNFFRDVSIIGPGAGSATNGMYFYSNSGTYSYFNSRSTFQNITINYFGTDVYFSTNAYLVSFSNFTFGQATTVVATDPAATNAGENISFIYGVIAESTTGVYDNGPMTLNFDHVSFDFNTVNLNVNYGIINCNVCHFEQTVAGVTTPQFNLGNYTGTTINIMGGDYILDGTPPVTGASCLFQTNGKANLIINGMSMTNLGVGSNSLVCGIPFSIINTPAPQYGVGFYQTAFLGQSGPQNLFGDGGFEAASIQGLTWINTDTAAITSRTTGTNISYALSTDTALSGTQSLKLTKVGSSGTAASVLLAAPFPSQQVPLSTSNVAKLGTQTGSVTATLEYLQILGFNSYGIPIVGKTQTLTSNTTTLTSSSLAWTSLGINADGQQTYRAPTWANYIGILVDVTAMDAGSIYLDNFTFNSI